MTWQRRCGGLLAALLVATPGFAASNRFDAAVDDTGLGPDAGRAFVVVEALTAQGRVDDAEALRRALWQRQLAQMLGKPLPDEPRVAQAIAEGRELPAPDAAFHDRWRDAYNAAARLSFRPAGEPGERPAAFAAMTGVAPLGGDVWTVPGDAGLWGYHLTLTLEAAIVPLPLQSLQLRFGAAEDGLSLRCTAAPGATSASPGQPVALGCEGVGDARWQMLLPALVGAARSGGPAPRLVPPAIGADPGTAEPRLWRLWNPDFARELARWRRVQDEARDAAGASARWVASSRPVPPQRQAAATGPARAQARRPGEIWPSVRLRLMVSALALGLFAVPSLALREAALATRARVSIALGVLVAVPLLATVWGPGTIGGDGWANLGVVVSGLALAMGVSLAVIVALLLHRVHDLLAADGQTWLGVIRLGWRRAFWMFGRATKAEFWGFVLFASWAWALVVPLGSPWTGIAGLALLVPLWSVAWRRALSLTRAEIGIALAIIATWIIDLILRQHL